MYRVQIVDIETRTIEYTDKAGETAAFTLQTCYIWLVGKNGKPAPYPEKLDVAVERDDKGNPRPPLPPGEYTLAPSSVYVDQRGRLAIQPRLQPVPVDPKPTVKT